MKTIVWFILNIWWILYLGWIVIQTEKTRKTFQDLRNKNLYDTWKMYIEEGKNKMKYASKVKRIEILIKADTSKAASTQNLKEEIEKIIKE